jgi:hypothetical protein
MWATCWPWGVCSKPKCFILQFLKKRIALVLCYTFYNIPIVDLFLPFQTICAGWNNKVEQSTNPAVSGGFFWAKNSWGEGSHLRGFFRVRSIILYACVTLFGLQLQHSCNLQAADSARVTASVPLCFHVLMALQELRLLAFKCPCNHPNTTCANCSAAAEQRV